MADDKEAAEALIADLQKKIKDAFAVFDHEGNNTVDVREIGTIIRSLGCCPSEEELHEMLAEGISCLTNLLEFFEEVTDRIDKAESVDVVYLDFQTAFDKVEEEEPTGYIQFDKFLPMMTKVLIERKYRPQPEDVILRAFEVLDKNNNGYLTQEELTKYLTEEGEPFTQEEMEEMLSAAVDPDKNVILYKDFAAMMTVEDY